MVSMFPEVPIHASITNLLIIINMVIKKTYTLVKKDVPVIKNRVVLEDPGVGGVKLVYDVLEQHFKEMNILGYKILNPFPSFKCKKKQVILRPFKEVWDKDKNRLPRNYWGKKTDPLTFMWVELEFDYDSLEESLPLFKEQILDHALIKHLKHIEDEFSLYYPPIF